MSINKRRITRSELAEDVRKMGLGEGDHVALGISLREVGWVEGGPDTLIDAVMDVVGAGGTIMLPTYTHMHKLAVLQSESAPPPYHPELTPTYTGLLPQQLISRKDSIRSLHPTNSVTAMGHESRFLTANHDADAGAYSAYSRLAEVGGKYLGIGLDNRVVGIHHEAQARAGLLSVVPYGIGVHYHGADGEVRVFERKDKGGCVRQLGTTTALLIERKYASRGMIGQAGALIVDAGASLEYLTELLSRDPTETLCQEADCLWCRELERRLGLYSRIDNPTWFQRSRLARRILAHSARERLDRRSSPRRRNLWQRLARAAAVVY